MTSRLFPAIIAAAVSVGWGAAACAAGIADLNNCRMHQADSIAACDRVIEACKDLAKIPLNPAACPLYDATDHTAADVGFALAGTYVDRAGAYIRTQNFDQALADYERALAWKSPYSAAAYRGRGQILVFKGRYEDAVANFAAAIANPMNDPAATAAFHYQRAYAYLQLDKLDLSRADLDQAIGAKPRPEFYLLRANLSAREGKFDQAQADVATILQQQPNDTNALTARGTIYRRQKRWDAALADLNKAIELQPLAMPAVFERARVYVDMGDLDRALVDLDKVLAGPAKNSAVYLERGLARLAKGNRDGARSDLAAALTFPSLNGERGNTHALAKAALAKM
jgi:tetratricopeptide (TPR) repeat protein